MELFDERVVMFESDEGGEYLLVTCEPSGMGGLVVRQTSEGPLTRWCYEESPHVVETLCHARDLRHLSTSMGLELLTRLLAC